MPTAAMPRSGLLLRQPAVQQILRREDMMQTSFGPSFQMRSPATPNSSWLTAMTSSAIRMSTACRNSHPGGNSGHPKVVGICCTSEVSCGGLLRTARVCIRMMCVPPWRSTHRRFKHHLINKACVISLNRQMHLLRRLLEVGADQQRRLHERPQCKVCALLGHAQRLVPHLRYPPPQLNTVYKVKLEEGPRTQLQPGCGG